MNTIDTKLSIKNMSFRFASSQSYFFKDISIAFEPKKIHFIQGKNGVGKSTFFKILQGKISTDSHLTGTFSLDKKSYTAVNNQLPSAFTSVINAVDQNVQAMLADEFTGEQNLRLANLPALPGFKQLPQKKNLDDLTKHFSLNLKVTVNKFSGGQRQILAILMMLQKPTKILLLDEPTAALDPQNAHIVIQFLQKITEQMGLTILIITHDKELIQTYADQDYIELEVQKDGTRKFIANQEQLLNS